jgi:hypothetical protein
MPRSKAENGRRFQLIGAAVNGETPNAFAICYLISVTREAPPSSAVKPQNAVVETKKAGFLF